MTFKIFLKSSIGQKYVMSLTGLALVAFVIVHLLGNLGLYSPESEVFNTYAHKLQGLGDFLEVAEVGLFLLFFVHLTLAIWIKIQNRSARPVTYSVSPKTKGGENQNTLASRSMVITGVLILAFLILHLIQFQFGPSVEEGYVTTIAGEPARDIYRLVKETLEQPLFAGIYMVAMLVLGLHLRHGIWSAFQSLGLLTERNSRIFYRVALVLALLLAFGFFLIPFWFVFGLHQVFL